MRKKFNSVLIIGMGLIGSSISRALNENHAANNVYGLDSDDKVIKKLLSEIDDEGCMRAIKIEEKLQEDRQLSYSDSNWQ